MISTTVTYVVTKKVKIRICITLILLTWNEFNVFSQTIKKLKGRKEPYDRTCGALSLAAQFGFASHDLLHRKRLSL